MWLGIFQSYILKTAFVSFALYSSFVDGILKNNAEI